MPRITLIVTAALAAFAICAPVATAMPQRDGVGTTAAPQQDLRGADARAASASPQAGTGTASGPDVRTPDARDAGAKPAEPVPGLPTWPADPKPIAPAPIDATPVAGGDDTSPLPYILPAIALSLLLAAGLGHAVRTSARARRARISA
jgi:hypothetical protein